MATRVGHPHPVARGGGQRRSGERACVRFDWIRRIPGNSLEPLVGERRAPTRDHRQRGGLPARDRLALRLNHDQGRSATARHEHPGALTSEWSWSPPTIAVFPPAESATDQPCWAVPAAPIPTSLLRCGMDCAAAVCARNSIPRTVTACGPMIFSSRSTPPQWLPPLEARSLARKDSASSRLSAGSFPAKVAVRRGTASATLLALALALVERDHRRAGRSPV
jgi:hypothetical protein